MVFLRLCAPLFLVTVLGFMSVAGAGDKTSAAINCDIQNGVCSQSLNGRQVTLEILPRPVHAMEELTFRVTLDGKGPKPEAHIKLGMPAMKMGKNDVALKLTDQGHYEGKGTIVRCRSGKRTWFARIMFAGLGESEFVFDVIY